MISYYPTKHTRCRSIRLRHAAVRRFPGPVLNDFFSTAGPVQTVWIKSWTGSGSTSFVFRCLPFYYRQHPVTRILRGNQNMTREKLKSAISGLQDVHSMLADHHLIIRLLPREETDSRQPMFVLNNFSFPIKELTIVLHLIRVTLSPCSCRFISWNFSYMSASKRY